MYSFVINCGVFHCFNAERRHWLSWRGGRIKNILKYDAKQEPQNSSQQPLATVRKQSRVVRNLQKSLVLFTERRAQPGVLCVSDNHSMLSLPVEGEKIDGTLSEERVTREKQQEAIRAEMFTPRS